jgi:hypothetical protein
MIVPDTDLEILESWLQIWILICNTSFWLRTMLQKIDFVDIFDGPQECNGQLLCNVAHLLVFKRFQDPNPESCR